MVGGEVEKGKERFIKYFYKRTVMGMVQYVGSSKQSRRKTRLLLCWTHSKKRKNLFSLFFAFYAFFSFSLFRFFRLCDFPIFGFLAFWFFAFLFSFCVSIFETG